MSKTRAQKMLAMDRGDKIKAMAHHAREVATQTQDKWINLTDVDPWCYYCGAAVSTDAEDHLWSTNPTTPRLIFDKDHGAGCPIGMLLMSCRAMVAKYARRDWALWLKVVEQ